MLCTGLNLRLVMNTNFANQFLTLLRKEFVIEFRQRYAISGIVLYVISMVFVVYASSIKVGPKEWNVFFWLIVLFAEMSMEGSTSW